MTRRIGAFEAALFDLDGTLIDSAGAGERAWVELARRWQLTTPDASLFRAVHGMPAREALKRMLPEVLVTAALRELENIEIGDTAGIRDLPGAGRLLQSIPDSRRAIVTSSFRQVAIARLASAGIVAPSHMITCEDITRGKPDPEPFLCAAADLATNARSTVAFEDTRPGIRSAKAAGCTVIAVEGLHESAELGEADYVVKTLAAVHVLDLNEHGFSIELA